METQLKALRVWGSRQSRRSRSQRIEYLACSRVRRLEINTIAPILQPAKIATVPSPPERKQSLETTRFTKFVSRLPRAVIACSMKRMHRPDLWGWSEFNEDRNLDFHSLLWVREGGNVAVDPLPLSPHDSKHLKELGTLATIVITNSDHVRDAEALAKMTGARIVGPEGERSNFPIACDEWLKDGQEITSGLRVLALEGSKTPGELALVLEDSTLITGDLIRSHVGGELCMLPTPKLADAEQAIASIRRVAQLALTTVLPGDGWPVFRDGKQRLNELMATLA